MALPSSSCPVCKATQDLLRCQACKVVCYCSKDHQVVDRPTHMKACKGIKKAQTHFNKEEQTLRDFPGDLMTEANPLENSVGHFGDILETRAYMRARFRFIDALLKVDTRSAVELALSHAMDCQRLCRSDEIGLRCLAPALILRLGRNQACYDFIKWWTVSADGTYDPGNMDLPFLDINDANVLEPVDIFLKYGESIHIIAITLLKIRIFLDLTSLQNSRIVGENVPQEVLDGIRSFLMEASPIGTRPDIIDNKDNSDLILTLQTQVRQLYTCVDSKNTHFWTYLLSLGYDLDAEPESYSDGSVLETELAVRYCNKPWIETPGAMDMIRQLKDEMND